MAAEGGAPAETLGNPQGQSLQMAPMIAALNNGRVSSGAAPFAVGSRNYFFGTTASLQAFATRNFTTVFAGILIEAPV